MLENKSSNEMVEKRKKRNGLMTLWDSRNRNTTKEEERQP